MGLWDLFEDLERSHEKREDTKRYIRQAKELVKSADEIYEKAYSRTMDYAYETESRLSDHAEYKKSIAKELGGNVGTTLKEFGQFDIDSKTFTAPSIQSLGSIPSFSGFGSSFASAVPRVDLFSILDMFISDEDYEEARDQYYEAKKYKSQMIAERDKLNSYREKMSEIRTFISSERGELDSLMGKLRKMTSQLNSGMQKSRFTPEEATYLKGIHKVAESVSTLLSTSFLNDTFSISQKYQKAFEEVKAINQALPSSPALSDITTSDAIKIILGKNLIYN